jgi:hypothetical protein
MLKRSVTAVLWFLAAGWGWNLLSLATGLPAFPGIVLGLALAAVVLVGSDPRFGAIVRRRRARPTTDPTQPSRAAPDRLRA